MEGSLDSANALSRRTQISYLLGRIPNPQQRRAAWHLLQQRRTRLDEMRDDVPPLLVDPYFLLVRTVYISLIYLYDRNRNNGEGDPAQDYVAMLLNDPHWERVNRGFHLEYYGDCRFDPTKPLTNEDKLGPCSNTLKTLLRRLEQTKKPGKLYALELFTVCSLAQHRHAVGRLSEADRDKVRRAIAGSRAVATIPGHVSRHRDMVDEHLGTDGFRPELVTEQLYGLKSILRSGWVAKELGRHVPETEAETVAAHSFGAALLAMLYLPDVLSEDIHAAGTHDKWGVVRILLVHDLAEAYIGDLLPSQKNADSNREEEARFSALGLLGSYDGFRGTSGIYQLWSEFQARTTKNALLAKDFDRLDNLLQLRIYQREYEIQDAKSWADGLTGSLKTRTAQRVADRLRAHFDGAPLDHSGANPKSS